MKQWKEDVSVIKEKSLLSDSVKIYESYYKNDLTKNEEVLIGIDEVGVSSIAGPMVAAIVALPKNHTMHFLPVDSKLLDDDKIKKYAEIILKEAKYVCLAGLRKINTDKSAYLTSLTKQLWKSLYVKMYEDVSNKKPNVLSFVIDGGKSVKDMKFPNYRIKGDAKFPAVSAAAIVAKYFTNIYFMEMHKKYPEYEFNKNKGYASFNHIQAIKKLGTTPIHRLAMTGNSLEEVWDNPEEFRIMDKNEVNKQLFLIYLYYETARKTMNPFLNSLTKKFKYKVDSVKMHFYLNKEYESCLNSFNYVTNYNGTVIIERFKRIESKVNWEVVYTFKKQIHLESFPGYNYLYSYKKYKPLDYEVISKEIESFFDMLVVLEKAVQYEKYMNPYENSELIEELNKYSKEIALLEEGRDKNLLRLVYLQLRNKTFCSATQINRTKDILSKLKYIKVEEKA